MPSEKLDINGVLANRAEIKINPEETQDERAERLRQEARQHTFELVKSYLVFFLIVGALTASIQRSATRPAQAAPCDGV